MNETLIKACETGDLQKVEKLLKKTLFRTPADVNFKMYGKAPLYRASTNGYIEIVKLLIDKGADINIKNDDDRTPLYQASIWDYKEIAEILIDKGADINVKDKNGETPLFGATFSCKDETAKILIIKGADVHCKGRSDKTPLHNACRYHHKEIVEMLIAKGADANVQDIYGDSPLHEAHSNKDIIELIINKGADVNVRNKRGETPLFQAIRDKEIVELLINKGADINIPDYNGSTPLNYALYLERKGTIELLTNKGAQLGEEYEPKEPTPRKPLTKKVEYFLDAIVIVFNCDFPTKYGFAEEILNNLTTRGKTYKSWMKNNTPVLIKVHQKAQDQMTVATIALVEFRKLIGNKADPGNIQFGTFEGSRDIFGSVLSYWH